MLSDSLETMINIYQKYWKIVRAVPVLHFKYLVILYLTVKNITLLSRFIFINSFFLFFFSCFSFQLSAQTNTWDGSSSNNWNTAANWSLGSVPTNAHDVVININANISVDASSTINSLTISNSAAVTFTSSGGGRIITIDNSGSTISAGSTLTLRGSTGSGTRLMRIAYSGSNCTMLIEGSLILTAVGEGTSYIATNSLTTVSGTIKNDGSGGGTSGSISSNASNLTFLPGGTYEHALNAGSIPTATWNTTSTCLVKGITSTIPGGLVQNFANLIYNCPAQSGNLNITTTQILGNFEIISTGNFQLRLNTNTLTVGSFTQSGGDFSIASGTARTINNNGNFSMSGGTLTLSIGSGIGTLNSKGDFTQSGGLITETSTGSGAVNFTGTGLQIFTSGGTISNIINFTISSGSIIDFGTSVLAGSTGSFNLSSGAGIFTANTNSSGAITTSGNNGSIQVTGTRTYSTGANYTYNGASAQFTGNGLPSTVNNLTINNSGGTVTLTNASVTISNQLALNSIFTTGANSVIVNNTATVVRTSGHINGNLQLKNSVGTSTKTYDIGDAINYTPVTISFANITTAGGVTTSATSGDHPNIGSSDINSTLSVNRYWTISNNGTAFNSYTADFTFTGSDLDPGTDFSNFISGKYSASSWTYPTVETITSTNIQVTGLTAFGDFQFGESLSAPSPCAYGDNGNNPAISDVMPCINTPANPQSLSTTLAAHQYFTMNVIKGMTYEVYTCNTSPPSSALKLVVYEEGAPATPYLAFSYSNTGNPCTNAANNVYATFTPDFSGQVRVLINRRSNCSSTTPGGLNVIINVSGGANILDDQSSAGSDSWIAHLYEGTNSTKAFNENFTNYLGYYTENETFDETFGTGTNDIDCFSPILSANINRASLKTITYSARYRMNSTRRGLYATNLGSDDGSRLSVDGNLIFTNWSDHGYILNSNLLMSLSGSSSLKIDYYENAGSNRITFQNLTLLLSNTLASGINQVICLDNPAIPISGDIFGSLPAGITLSGTGYQWTYSTSPTGTRNVITGATDASFTPNTSIAPFNVPGTYYVFRNAILSSSNNTNPNPYIATNESNAAIIIISPILVAGVSIVANPTGDICPGTNVTFTATPVNGGNSPAYQWKLNGTNVGTNNNQYSNNSLVDSDIVSCVMVSNELCISGNPANSNTISISVINLTQPGTISVSPTTITSTYTGQITLSANGGGGTGAILKWYSGTCATGVLVGSGSPLSIAPPTVTTTYYARWETSNCQSDCISATVSVICSSASSQPELYESITNVTFAGINNSSPVIKTTGYTDYTALVPAANVAVSGTYPISVSEEFVDVEYGGYCKVFIDYNQNGVFDIPEEVVFEAPYVLSITMNGNVTIPLNALPGTTLMRVVVNGDGTSANTLPCGSYVWGETEDYLVTIQGTSIPQLNVVPTSINFGYVASGGTSGENTYMLSGINLTPASGNITLNAPSNFEISLSSGSGFGTDLTLPYTQSTILPTTIYVHFKPTTPNTNYSGSITNTGGGAVSKSVNVSGTSMQYCTSSGNTIYQTGITLVHFNTIINSSGKPSGYTDYYTTQSTSVARNSNYDLSVNLNTDGNYTIHAIAWIDWNQDGDFTDTGEEFDLGSATNTTNGTTNLSPLILSIPADAALGATRMRVSAQYNTNPTPCINNFDGEVEDYCIMISLPYTYIYRSIATGLWSDFFNWESSPDNGFNWSSATAPPDSTDGTITIRTPDVITLNSIVTIDQLTIDAGGTLSLAANMDITDGDGDDITVNGTLNCDNSLVLGTGTFILNSGATLLIGSPEGITQSGTTGNIQTASRTYSTGANYAYNAISSQTTGNGLPAIVNNLSINNSAGVSLLNDVTMNGSLSLTSGEFSVGSRTITFQNSDNPIVRNSGTITTTENTNIIFGTSGNMDGNAFVIPSGTFTTDPTLNNFTINRFNDLTLNNQMISLKGVLLCNTCTLNSSGNLTLLSTSGQTALIDGAGTGQVIGNVTMQRYLPSGYGYRYFSSPFQAATVNEFADEINLSASFPTFYSYNENNYIDTSGVSVYSTGWSSYITTSGILEPMRGYAANFGNSALPITVDITGVVNNNIQTSLTLFNHDRVYTKGFNLTGNPYPSPIDWNANTGWTKNNIDNAIYYFNPGVTDQYTGTYSSYINNISSDGLASSLIPSMQGFFVHVTNGTYPVTAGLGMDNRVRINTLIPLFHKSVSRSQAPTVRLAAAYKNMNEADPVVVYFESLASAGFDKDYDALKLLNTDESIPNFYSFSDQSEKLSINALPLLTEGTTISRIGLKTKKSDWVTIKALSLENIPNGIRVFLSDELTGMIQDLNIEKDYSIFLEAGFTDNRFALLFSTSDLTQKPKTEETFFAYFANGNLNVAFELPSGSTARMVACNILGQTVMQKNITSNELQQFDFQFPAGVYILTLYSQNGIHSQKIYIPN